MPRLKSDLEYPYNLLTDIVELRPGMRFIPDKKPKDFAGSLEYILHTLSKQEYEFIQLRYKERMTYSKIAVVYGVSRERVREVLQVAQRKLSHPQRWKYIEFGVKGIEERIAKKSANEDNMLVKNDIETTALRKSILDMKLCARTTNALLRTGLRTVGDIVAIGNEGLHHIKHIGKHSLNEVLSSLEGMGIDLPDEGIDEMIAKSLESESNVAVNNDTEAEIFRKNIEDMKLGVRATNTLLRAGLKTVGDIAAIGNKGLYHIFERVGKHSLNEVLSSLDSMGIALKDNVM